MFYKFSFLSFILAGLALCFVSCSSNDDDEVTVTAEQAKEAERLNTAFWKVMHDNQIDILDQAIADHQAYAAKYPNDSKLYGRSLTPTVSHLGYLTIKAASERASFAPALPKSQEEAAAFPAQAGQFVGRVSQYMSVSVPAFQKALDIYPNVQTQGFLSAAQNFLARLVESQGRNTNGSEQGVERKVVEKCNASDIGVARIQPLHHFLCFRRR